MSNLNNVSDKAKDIVDNVADEAGSLKGKVQHLGAAIKDNATDLGKEAISRAYSAQEFFIEYVKNNPYKSLGMAFVAGLFMAKCRKSN